MPASVGRIASASRNSFGIRRIRGARGPGLIPGLFRVAIGIFVAFRIALTLSQSFKLNQEISPLAKNGVTMALRIPACRQHVDEGKGQECEDQEENQQPDQQEEDSGPASELAVNPRRNRNPLSDQEQNGDSRISPKILSGEVFLVGIGKIDTPPRSLEAEPEQETHGDREDPGRESDAGGGHAQGLEHRTGTFSHAGERG
jgi:hypothetical protein